MKNLIKVKNANPDEIPYTQNTCYKFHSLGRYPNILFKVGGQLVFDMDEWEKEVEKARSANIKKASKLKLNQ